MPRAGRPTRRVWSNTVVGNAGLELGQVAMGTLYHSAEEFADAFRREDPVAAFVQFILATRQNPRSKKTYEDALKAARDPGPTPYWLKDVIAAAFAVYCTVRRSAAPMAPRPRVVTTGSMHLPRRIQRILNRHGIPGHTQSDRRTVHQKAMDNFDVLWETIRDVHVVLWLDNYYRRRFVANPAVGYTALSCSVLSVLHIRRIPMCPAPPTINELLRARGAVAQELGGAARRLVAFVKTLTANTIAPDEIRVPLDLPRTNVRSLQWQPLRMMGQSVGRNDHTWLAWLLQRDKGVKKFCLC